jgi:CBS domain-containing protein
MNKTMQTGERAKRGRICVDGAATIVTASRLMRSFQVEELVVTDRPENGPVPVGIVSARDIVIRIIAAGLDPEAVTAGDIAWEATAAGNIGSDLLRSLLTSGSKILPVLDCNGDLTGVVTVNELLHATGAKWIR